MDPNEGTGNFDGVDHDDLSDILPVKRKRDVKFDEKRNSKDLINSNK